MSDHVDLNKFFEEQEQPWWISRCTHRGHSYWYDEKGQEFGCWRVLKEAEGAAILQLTCLNQVHLLVDNPGQGSVCKTLSLAQYKSMDEAQILALTQNQFKELKQIPNPMEPRMK